MPHWWDNFTEPNAHTTAHQATQEDHNHSHAMFAVAPVHHGLKPGKIRKPVLVKGGLYSPPRYLGPPQRGKK